VESSGRGGDLTFIFDRANPAGPATRCGRFVLLGRCRFRFHGSDANRRRKDVLRNALILIAGDGWRGEGVAVAAVYPLAAGPALRSFGALVTCKALAPLALIVTIDTVGPVRALDTVAAIITLGAHGTVVPLKALGSNRPFAAVTILAILAITGGTVSFGAFTIAILPRLLLAVAIRLHVLVVEFVAFLVVLPARTLVLDAGAILTEHAKIMVGKLQVIFGLHPVAGELGITRQALVLLQQLGGVAPLPIVAGVATGVAGHAPGSLPTAAATATTLAIVHQILVPCRTGA
jgi:hypothetical protein